MSETYSTDTVGRNSERSEGYRKKTDKKQRNRKKKQTPSMKNYMRCSKCGKAMQGFAREAQDGNRYRICTNQRACGVIEKAK